MSHGHLITAHEIQNFKYICVGYKIVVQSPSHVWLFVTPWTVACQASLSFTISWSLLKLMSIEPVMPSNCLILCCSLLLLPSISPSIRIFSIELVLHKGNGTPVFLPGKSYGQMSLVGFSPWGHKRVRHNLVTKKNSMYIHIYVYAYMQITNYIFIYICMHIYIYVIHQCYG